MSLDGMSALISLEGARLEGAKQTSQNSQQVGSTVHQQGLQFSEKKQNLLIQHINAEYEKECAAAHVKRMESKYARERAAESLAGAIAQIVTAGSLLSNVWDAGKDLLGGAQKLGDIPNYLQVKKLDPDDPNTKVSTSQPDASGARTITITGKDKDSKNVAYSFVQSSDGSISSVKAGTFKDDEIKGKESVSLDLRSIGRGEVPGFMKMIEGFKENGKTVSVTSKDGKVTNEPVINKKNIESIKESLISTGKAKEHDFDKLAKATDNVLDVTKSVMGVMVQTAQDAMPYFKAYMEARKKADHTWENKSDDGAEDLIGAIAKLNAANKKLYSIEKQIDLMNLQSVSGTH